MTTPGNIPCSSCGYDPTRTVLYSHDEQFRFKWLSGNVVNPYVTQGRSTWRYRSYKEGFKKKFRTVAHKFKPANKNSFYRLTLTRLYGKGPRGGSCYEFDLDNLAQGAKPMIDVLVDYEVLVDDSPKYTEVHYRQEPSPDGKHYVRVLVEELA